MTSCTSKQKLIDEVNQRRIHWVFQKAYYRDKLHAYYNDSLKFEPDTSIQQFEILRLNAIEEMDKAQDSIFNLDSLFFKE